MATKGCPQRSYTKQEREDAVALSNEIGTVAAAEKLKIPRGSLAVWRLRARQVGSTGMPTEGDNERQVAKSPPAESDAVQGKTQTTATPQADAAVTATSIPTRQRHVARVYTPSQKAEALELMRVKGPAEANRKLGISRFSLYEWKRLVEASKQDDTVPSPIAGPDIDKARERDQRIVREWRKHPGLGPSQIRNQLRRDGFKVSVRTTRMVMQENGYVAPKVKRVESHDQCYEAVRPNQMWHMDFLQRHVHKQKISLLFLVDDYSRFIPGFAMCDEDRAEVVIECFESSVSRHGRPESVMSDGGSAFWAWNGVSRFTRLLDEMEVDQIIAKTPQVNGKVEVLNANVQKELFAQERFFSLGEAHARLRAWVSFYNFGRTHHALGGLLVPADRYFGRADEVLAQVEAGHNAKGVGEPIAVGERQLDLLRVSSRAGRLELLVMGERVWPQSNG